MTSNESAGVPANQHDGLVGEVTVNLLAKVAAHE